MQMDFRRVILQIIKMSELMQTMEEAYNYLQQKPNDQTVNEMFLQGAQTLCAQSEELFSYKMNNMQLRLILKNFISWQQDFWSQNIQQLWNLMGQLQNNQMQTIPQCSQDEINLIIAILDSTTIAMQQKGVFRITLSNFCRLSAPELSFQLLMQGMEMHPNIFANTNGHLKNYVYKPYVKQEQREFQKCPICGGIGHPFHAVPSFRMIDFGDVFLPAKLWMRCEKCENLYSKYFPEKYLRSEDGICFIYPEEIETYQCRNLSAHILHFWGEVLTKMQKQSGGHTLLEIGIGEGALIAVAKEMGFAVEGVELVKQLAQDIANLLKVNITCCDFLEYPEDKQYDMITMGDVLEHLSNPRKGLEKARKLLQNNGVLWMSTPNYESAYNQLHHMHTAMWLEPTHVTYFNRRGLENLLQEVGFEVIEYQISNHYNGSMEMLVRKKIK